MNKAFKFGCGSIVALFVLIILLAVIGGGDSEPATTPKETQTAAPASQTTQETPQAVEEPKNDVPREYEAALVKAKLYAETMYMSKAGVHNQLVSDYGEKFSAEAAQYAMDNLEHDWKANALQKAKTYANDMAMSNTAIYDQLISEYGEKFTVEEAQYAIDNLE